MIGLFGGSWKVQWLPKYACYSGLISSVKLLSHVWLFVTPWTTVCQASLSITNSQSLLKLMSIALVMSSNHLILCCPLFLLTSIFPSIRVLSNELALRTRWSKYWNVNVSPSNEYSGLISFSIDWFDLLAAQGTLKKTECQRIDTFKLQQGDEWNWNTGTKLAWSL